MGTDNPAQNGTVPARPEEPYRWRRFCQICSANSLRFSGGVARIISTAAVTGIASDSPRMDRTAVSHCPRLAAPLSAGLYCRVSLPIPARRSVFAQRTLQLRQVHRRLAGSPCSSWPSAWPISTLRRLPHKAQTGSPGGGRRLARYRSARSLIWRVSLRLACPPAGRVSPGRHPCRRRPRRRRPGRRRPGRRRPHRPQCPTQNRACH